MPTKKDFEELYNNTTVTWTQQNGVCAGFCDDELNNAGSNGNYWSSLSDTNGPYRAWYFNFGSDYYNVDRHLGRSIGQSVRPVCSSPQN
jgi:hypothetical protein